MYNHVRLWIIETNLGQCLHSETLIAGIQLSLK
jgi:hypothetical protein